MDVRRRNGSRSVSDVFSRPVPLVLVLEVVKLLSIGRLSACSRLSSLGSKVIHPLSSSTDSALALRQKSDSEGTEAGLLKVGITSVEEKNTELGSTGFCQGGLAWSKRRGVENG